MNKVVLYGAPGCGKSTLMAALAMKFSTYDHDPALEEGKKHYFISTEGRTHEWTQVNVDLLSNKQKFPLRGDYNPNDRSQLMEWNVYHIPKPSDETLSPRLDLCASITLTNNPELAPGFYDFAVILIDIADILDERKPERKSRKINDIKAALKYWTAKRSDKLIILFTKIDRYWSLFDKSERRPDLMLKKYLPEIYVQYQRRSALCVSACDTVVCSSDDGEGFVEQPKVNLPQWGLREFLNVITARSSVGLKTKTLSFMVNAFAEGTSFLRSDQGIDESSDNINPTKDSAVNGLQVFASLSLPGLGQLWQERHKPALVFFILAVVVWYVSHGYLGWIMHLWSCLDAYRWRPRS